MAVTVLRTMLLIVFLMPSQGCLGRSPAVRHFMLGTSPSSTTVLRSLDIAVLVGPVRVPAYLERSQIASLAGVTRSVRRKRGEKIEVNVVARTTLSPDDRLISVSSLIRETFPRTREPLQ